MVDDERFDEFENYVRERLNAIEEIFGTLKRSEMSETSPEITYICDGKRCEHCNPYCHLTRDISHAVNFELLEEVPGAALKYFEKDKDTCSDCFYSSENDFGRIYCVAWGDGVQGEWTKLDGYCHKWKKREQNIDLNAF